MALEGVFLEFFKQSVEIAPYAGNDQDGAPTHHTPVTFPARVAGASRRILTDQGQVVDASQVVYIPTAEPITTKDQITLPEGYEPRTPQIIAVNRYPDETGVIHHTTVYV